MRKSRVVVVCQRHVSASLFFASVLLFAGGPVWATFPGQNGRIVFVANPGSSWQLYTINPDGTGMKQITNLPATSFPAWGPEFSPDGEQIAFCYGPVDANGNAHTDLYVMNAEGGGLTRLTDDGLSLGPQWSPDGTRLVFVRTDPVTNVGVVTTMRSDGTGEKSALTTRFWDSGSYGPGPAGYTPDGREIVFYSQQGGLAAAAWIMDTHGSHQRQLTPAPLEGAPTNLSADGQHILLFNHNNTDLPQSIFVMNIDGSDLRQLTYARGLQVDLPASYSPDGTKIVFLSNRFNPNRLDLFTMNADGSDVKRIATGVGFGASWGPKPTD